MESEQAIEKQRESGLSAGRQITFIEIVGPREGLVSRFLLFGSAAHSRKSEAAIREGWDRAYQAVEEDLRAKGLLKEQELLAPAKVERGAWGDVRGEWALRGFLLFIQGGGRLKGDTRTVSSVQFAWSPNQKDILISELPVDKLVFQVDQSTETPRVTFEFDPRKFVKFSDRWEWGNPTRYYIEVSSFRNINDYLMGDRLTQAILKISSAEDLKGLPLPK